MDGDTNRQFSSDLYNCGPEEQHADAEQQMHAVKKDFKREGNED